MTVEFSAARLPFDANQLIEASAGTGKTYTITNLVLRLLLGRGHPALAINQILVLTFTVAATAELRARITRRINEARQAYRDGTDDEFLAALIGESEDKTRDQKLLAAAVSLMDEASIFTIHGFCTRVLAEQAFESGVLFNQELSAERDELLLKAAEDFFRADILTLPPEIRQIALALWQGPEKLGNSLKSLLFRGPMELHPADIQDVEPAALIELALLTKQQWLDDDIDTLLQGAGLKRGNKPFRRLSTMEEFCRSGSADFLDERWQIYSTTNLMGAITKQGTMPDHPIFDQFEAIAASAGRIRAWLWQLALQRVQALVQAEKDQWQHLTLDDLLSRTASAVVRPDGRLAGAIASRWPLAMIDEFQDTDSIQNEIFSRVYGSEATLLMIGDPKQAIYSFRGADVYTYVNARRGTPGIHNLDVNWRSSPAMIAATNLLFSRPRIFDNDEDMPFQPVAASPHHADMKAKQSGEEMRPYQVFTLEDPTAFATGPVLLERAMNWAAEATAALLAEDSNVTLDGEPVKAGQIAFLVRKRTEATAARDALNQRGIRSVYLAMDSVFLQDTASDLRLILEAVAEPGNEQAVRSALATQLMQTDLATLDALNDDLDAQSAAHAEFRHYHELWLQHDIAPMLNQLMVRRQLAEKWLGRPDGERQITNYRHLVELLQERSKVRPGMFQLLKWFAREQQAAEGMASEERQLRLESDENLVKIVTMHAAKGLEYDVVMIPMPVFSKQSDSKSPGLFHREQADTYIAALELGDNPEHRHLASAELESEDMRLLYVALTRARYLCYLGVPKLSGLNGSAVSRLLALDRIEKTDGLHERVQAALPTDHFQVIDGNVAGCSTLAAGRLTSELSAPPARPRLPGTWRLHSYTSVVSRLAVETDTEVVRGYQDDDREAEPELAGSGLSKFTFPRGPRVGVALHSLLEDADFVDPSTHQELCRRTLFRLNLEDAWLPVLEAWLADILATPLATTKLNQVSRSDRLDEMEFHFPLSASGELTDFLLGHGYLTETGDDRLTLRGYMTGLIDLLYRHEGRYFIVDYKSNHLGNRPEQYASAALDEAMDHHVYHLQYLIYSVAVHRMLKNRLPDYDYEEQFGGISYLFLRGMNGGDQLGVFSARPEQALIVELDRLMGASG